MVKVKDLDEAMNQVFFGLIKILESCFSEMDFQEAQKFRGLVLLILKTLPMIIERALEGSKNKDFSKELSKHW